MKRNLRQSPSKVRICGSLANLAYWLNARGPHKLSIETPPIRLKNSPGISIIEEVCLTPLHLFQTLLDIKVASCF